MCLSTLTLILSQGRGRMSACLNWCGDCRPILNEKMLRSIIAGSTKARLRPKGGAHIRRSAPSSGRLALRLPLPRRCLRRSMGRSEREARGVLFQGDQPKNGPLVFQKSTIRSQGFRAMGSSPEPALCHSA